MIPENETYSFEDKIYQLPEVSRDEQLRAADAVRANQQATNQEIRTQTEQLGTDVPSIQGGLIGPESYFTARYQTPQTNAVVSQLRSAAQASALNQALSNLQAQWQERYQRAYRNYQKRGSRSSGTGTAATSTPTNTTVAGEVFEESTDTTAQPDEIMRRIERQKQEEENARKAQEYIEEVQAKTEQALTPQVNVMTPQEAANYWMNIRR